MFRNKKVVIEVSLDAIERVGYGLEDSKVDILNCIKKAEASLSGSYYEPVEHEVHENNIEMVGTREKVGNFLQCALRALGDSAAILCASLAVACVVEASLPIVAAGISSFVPPAISISGGGAVAVAAGQTVIVGESIALAAARVSPLASKLVENVAHFYGGKDCVKIGGGKNVVCQPVEEVITNKGVIKFTEKQLQKKFKHAKRFGINSQWSKNAAKEYQQAILKFVNNKSTEVMRAFYRKKAATIYINKTTRLFVVKINGMYRTGWRLEEAQMKGFLRSGNLN